MYDHFIEKVQNGILYCVILGLFLSLMAIASGIIYAIYGILEYAYRQVASWPTEYFIYAFYFVSAALSILILLYMIGFVGDKIESHFDSKKTEKNK